MIWIKKNLKIFYTVMIPDKPYVVFFIDTQTTLLFFDYTHQCGKDSIVYKNHMKYQ